MTFFALIQDFRDYQKALTAHKNEWLLGPERPNKGPAVYVLASLYQAREKCKAIGPIVPASATEKPKHSIDMSSRYH